MALCYTWKDAGLIPGGGGCYWNFTLTQSFRQQYDPWVDSVCNRNDYQEYFMGIKATDHAVALCYSWKEAGLIPGGVLLEFYINTILQAKI